MKEFSLQLDESTVRNNETLLLAYALFVNRDRRIQTGDVVLWKYVFMELIDSVTGFLGDTGDSLN